MAKGYRKINVLGRDFEYIIGRSFLKVKGLPAVDFSTLTGMPWSDIERGVWKRWFSVTPKDVRAYIESAESAKLR